MPFIRSDLILLVFRFFWGSPATLVPVYGGTLSVFQDVAPVEIPALQAVD